MRNFFVITGLVLIVLAWTAGMRSYAALVFGAMLLSAVDVP